VFLFVTHDPELQDQEALTVRHTCPFTNELVTLFCSAANPMNSGGGGGGGAGRLPGGGGGVPRPPDSGSGGGGDRLLFDKVGAVEHVDELNK
jgi:hypothetical protein